MIVYKALKFRGCQFLIAIQKKILLNHQIFENNRINEWLKK